MSKFRHLSDKLSSPAIRWALIMATTVPALRIYYVREMAAALIIFSVFFLAVAALVSIIFVLDFVSQRIMAWIEAGIMRSARWLVGALRGISMEWNFGRPVEYFRETRSGIQGLSRLAR